jgi:hypothetical protein
LKMVKFQKDLNKNNTRPSIFCGVMITESATTLARVQKLTRVR